MLAVWMCQKLHEVPPVGKVNELFLRDTNRKNLSSQSFMTLYDCITIPFLLLAVISLCNYFINQTLLKVNAVYLEVCADHGFSIHLAVLQCIPLKPETGPTP